MAIFLLSLLVVLGSKLKLYWLIPFEVVWNEPILFNYEVIKYLAFRQNHRKISLHITIGKIDDEWIGVTRGVGMAFSSIGKHMGPGWWYFITSDQLDSLDS